MREMLRPIPGVLAAFLVLAVTGCGPGGHKNSSGPPKIKAQPGHVITNPTAAQSYIYLPQTTIPESNGDILITDGGNWDRTGGKVVEMNPQGVPVWEYTGGLDFPHSAYPVGKNDILISDTNHNRVIMINRHGKTVWDTDNLGGGKGFLGYGRFSHGAKLLYPNDAVMEPGNEVLISSRFNNTVYEVDMQGKVTWQCSKFMFRQHRPRLLPNGNLMVPDSDNGRVLIINHACNKILFDYGGAGTASAGQLIWPRSFNPYPGGNYIIGDSYHSRVIEINPKGQVVQQWTGLPAPYYVEVMSNHNLLLGDSNIGGAVELGANGGIVKQYPTHNPTAYATSVVNGSFEHGFQGWLKGDLTAETLPPGKRADMTIDSSTGEDGKSSARISWLPNTPHLFLMYDQILSVTPGKSYNFTGWIKSKNIQTCTGCDNGPGTSPHGEAYYFVNYMNSNSPTNVVPAGASTNTVSGTTPWTKETTSFTPPAGVTKIEIEAIFWGRGTVWFDNVSVK